MRKISKCQKGKGKLQGKKNVELAKEINKINNVKLLEKKKISKSVKRKLAELRQYERGKTERPLGV